MGGPGPARRGHQKGGGAVNLRLIIFLNFPSISKHAFLAGTLVCNLFLQMKRRASTGLGCAVRSTSKRNIVYHIIV